MADSTLTAIRTKVRRITRSISATQLSNTDLDEYINTFIQYDMPEHLRLFSLKTTFTFYTNPFQDRYPTDIDSFAGVTNNPLYNFANRFITVEQPVYISGRPAYYSQSRDEFYATYPLINTIIDTGLRGDGVTTFFTGTITPPGGSTTGLSSLLQFNVSLTSVDTNSIGLAMVDRPVVSNTFGVNFPDGNLFPAGQVPALPPLAVDITNNIDYVTGNFTVTFPSAPANNEPIVAQVNINQPTRPQALLYFDNTFFVRPVPDKAYPVQFECYIRPLELLALNQSPQLEQWWQYIAYGAAKKVFEDRSDFDSVTAIMPEFKIQERLVLRRTIVQQTNERVATIYSQNLAGLYGPGYYNGNGFF